jgi:serine/threonine protein phosphatase PrpC
MGDVQLVVDQEMTEARIVPFAGGSAAVFSTHSPERSEGNQDSAALIELGPASGVMAVADGMGGQPAGASASQTAVQCLHKALLGAEPGEGDVRGSILDGIERANRAVLERGTGSATTLAVVEIRDGTLRPYHVGDSAILVTGQRGKLKLQTVAHSPVGYALESGLLDEREALAHDDRHLVSNAVGDAEMRIEVGSPLQLAARDTVVLATDGLFDNLGVAEIVAAVRAGPLPRVAAALTVACRQRMEAAEAGAPSKPDDVTFILFRRTP